MLLYSNERYREYSGIGTNIGTPVITFIHPDDYLHVSDMWEETIGNPGSIFKSEHRVKSKDGEYRWFSVCAVPVRNSLGEVVQWVGTSTDVHQRKLNEEALQLSYVQTQQIIDTAIDAVVSTDSNGIITGWSGRAEEMFGWSQEEVIGEPLALTILSNSLQADRTNPLSRFLNEAAGSVLKERIEVCAQHKSGTEFPIEISISCAPSGDAYAFSSFMRDLSERRQFENELRINEGRFRATFEQAAVGIVHMTVDGKWLRVNQRMCDMLRYTYDELTSRTYRDITHPDDYELDFPQLLEMLAGTLTTYSVEKRYLNKDGEIIWINNTVSLVRSAAGEPEYFIGIVEDITERKLAEMKLHTSHRILTSAEKIANMGSWEFDLNTNTIARSDELCRIIGVAESSQDSSFDRIVDMVHPVDRPKMSVLMGDAVQNRKAFTCKYRCIRPDNREIILSVRGEPIQNENGEVIRLIGSTRDVTLQEEKDRFLEQRSRMSALIADVGDALTRDTVLKKTLKRCCEAIVYRLEATVVRIWIVDASLNALELAASAGMSTSLDESLSSKPVPLEYDVRVCRIASSRVSYVSNNVQGEWRLQDSLWARGESIVAYAGLPLIVNNTLVGLAELFSRTIVTDIELDTLKSAADSIAVGIQRRIAEDQLIKLNLELERRVDERSIQLKAAIKELDAFAYSVSHDLRAPLRSIDGFAHAITQEFEDQMPDRVRAHLERVRKSAQKMGRLIEDLLTLSRIGRQPPNVQSTNMTEVLQNVIFELRSRYSDHQVEVVASDLPDCDCDQSLMSTVFINILSNSFKFTRSCHVPKIIIDYFTDSDELTFRVTDNGVGFEAEYAHKVFEPFQRLHRAEDFDGSGVGLAIVRRIIMLHGGRVWAESQPGIGSTFYFTLKRRSKDEPG
jgi:PAS domain S-box-containing protein